MGAVGGRGGGVTTGGEGGVGAAFPLAPPRGVSLGPGKRNLLLRRVPRAIARFAIARSQPFHVRSIHIHPVYLLRTAPPRSEYNISPRLGDLGLHFDGAGRRDRPITRAV